MNLPLTPTGSPIYALMLLTGIAWGAVYWFRESKKDSRVAFIYAIGLLGAFAGAKLAFLFAEGWLYIHDPNRWLIWLSGKSIMGALPGGWIAVELAKTSLGYRETTGDRFAILLPGPLILGRIGCLKAGCCGGMVCSFGTWPSVAVEIGFQIVALAVLLVLRRNKWQTGQHFHLFLMAYGLFRFFHEFMRATPKLFFGLSGYQLIALATAAAAGIAYKKRASAPAPAFQNTP
ncbi:MAG: prolipoprotein diacylglyceryl transferase family protein [Luteolibacter sp.]